MQKFIADKNKKLSKFILEKADNISYVAVMKLLRNKDIKVNGKRTGSDIMLSKNDTVEIYYNGFNVEKYSTVFEDENILVLNKKSGYTSESVFSSLQTEYKEIYFIHRLDRNTSGLMVFAKTKEAEGELLKGFKNRDFEKYYFTTVMGKMPKQEDVLTAFLLKDAENSTVKIFNKQVPNSVPIKTGYKVVRESENTSDIIVRLFTGKTHQIRAHLAFIGNPILGDGKYGDNDFNKKMHAKSQKLCAFKLVFHFESQDALYYLNNKIFELQV